MIKLSLWGLEALMIGLVLVLVYSQLIRPLMKKTPILPLIRPRRNIEREIEKVNEGLEDRGLERTLKEKRRKLGK